MSAGPIGEAHVLISPDLRGFAQRLKAELRAAMATAGDPKIGVDADTKGFGEQVKRKVKETERTTKTKVPVAPDLSRFAPEVRAFLARFDPKEQIKIAAALDRSAMAKVVAEAKAIAKGANAEIKVKTDARQASRDFELLGSKGRGALRGLSREVFNSNIRLREMANILGGATLPVLVSLASVGVAAFGSLSSAIVSAAAAAATLPNFLAAAVQALGVGALAFSGLGNAVKAMGQAQDAAGTSALSAARKDNTAAEQIKAAQRGVRDALQGVRDAQRGLNDARREARQRLVDLRLEETRLTLDQRGAALSIKEAEVDLRAVQADPAATNLERQRARLRLDEARQARTEIVRRIALNRQEIRSGVEGSDQVVAAKERQQGAAQSLRDAQEALAKATKSAALSTAAAAAPVAKLATAMDKLGPAGQRFARFLFSLKPKLDELRSVAQAGLFPGLEAAIRRLMTGLFPTFRTIVDKTAKTLGSLADEGAKMLASGPWRKDFATIGRTNVRLIDQFGHVGLNLADVLRNIMIAARPLTEAIGDMALKWSENTKASAQAGRDSGKLGKFFERVKTIVVSLLRIIGNVGATIGAVFSAALPSGGKLIGSLEEATDKMRELATSTEGRQNLKEFFDKARPAVETIGGLIVTLARKLFEIVVHVKNVTEAIAGFLEKNPQLKELVGSALALAFAFKLLNIAGLAGVVGSIGQLVRFNLPLALIAGAVLALGAAFVFAYTNSTPFREGVNSLARTIKDAVMPALRSFGGFITDKVIPALQRAIPFVRDQLVGGLDFLQQALKDNKPQLALVGKLLLEIGKFIAVTVIPAIFKLTSVHLRALFTSFGIIIGVIGVLVRVFKVMVSGVLAGFQTILDGAAAAFGWMPGIGGKLKTARDKFREFAKGVNDALDGVKNKKVTVTATGAIKLPKGAGSVHDLVGATGGYVTPTAIVPRRFHRGGLLSGPGTETSDSIPAWLSRGEYVVNAKAVRTVGRDALDWINAHKYASGGAVEDARFRVVPRTSTSALEEGVSAFDRLLDKVAVGLGKRLAATAPSGALSGARFGGAAMNYIASFLRDAGVAFKVISGFRPGAVTRGTGRQSLHALGRALDLVGTGKTSMLDIWAAATRIPFKKEVIFSPAPFQVYGSGKHPGPPTNPRTRADHYNHVHVGLFDRGGMLMPGLTLAENRSGRPERVVPATRDATGRLGFGGQGVTIQQLVVQPLSGRFRLADVMTELALQGVR